MPDAETDVIALHVSPITLRLLTSAWQKCDGVLLTRRSDGSFDLILTDDVEGVRSREPRRSHRPQEKPRELVGVSAWRDGRCALLA